MRTTWVPASARAEASFSRKSFVQTTTRSPGRKAPSLTVWDVPGATDRRITASGGTDRVSERAGRRNHMFSRMRSPVIRTLIRDGSAARFVPETLAVARTLRVSNLSARGRG